MDVVSHGLWGSLIFGKKQKRSFWLAFILGVLPDVLSFGPFFLVTFLGFVKRPPFGPEPPDPALIPLYVHRLYGITHSFIIFGIVFVVLWLIFKRPVWEYAAWGLHILFDIPTHSYRFFPTPFLWPISGFTFNGRSWADPWILVPNVVILLALYVYVFVIKKPRNN